MATSARAAAKTIRINLLRTIQGLLISDLAYGSGKMDVQTANVIL